MHFISQILQIESREGRAEDNAENAPPKLESHVFARNNCAYLFCAREVSALSSFLICPSLFSARDCDAKIENAINRAISP